jgi:hypothetical protein
MAAVPRRSLVKIPQLPHLTLTCENKQRRVANYRPGRESL